MKALIFTLSFLIHALCLSAQGKTGQTWKDVKQKGSGTLYIVYSEFPAFSFKNANGEYTGVDVDIMKDFIKYVKQTHSVELEAEFIDVLENDYNYLKNSSGGVVCVVDFVKTPQREKEVSFSNIFDRTYELLITQDKIPNLTSLNNLGKEFSALNGYAVSGTIQEKRLLNLKKQYYPAMKINMVNDYVVLQNAIIKDPKGMAVIDSYIYLELLRKKAPIKHHSVATQPSDVSSFIWPKDSDWLPVFNSFLSANGGYRDSPRYRDLLLKYVGESGLKLLKMSTDKK